MLATQQNSKATGAPVADPDLLDQVINLIDRMTQELQEIYDDAEPNIGENPMRNVLPLIEEWDQMHKKARELVEQLSSDSYAVVQTLSGEYYTGFETRAKAAEFVHSQLDKVPKGEDYYFCTVLVMDEWSGCDLLPGE